ncbi:hypothetical protein [Anaeromyxobacter oryzae]|uniref:hypothetical protein n=1 Tax=Anaeromyxobacter oryzae TaxID=2918170 RepID=UPI0020BF0210|nr:hypothetical protein [Anaeromyxobacter oryzae]
MAFIAMAALTGVPTLALAHPPCCVQCVNPHGETIPSAGSLPVCSVGLLPSANAFRAGENPDGFFLVGTTTGQEGAACGSGTSDVVLIDLGTGLTFAGPGPGGDFLNGTTLKYTQAPGTKVPDVDKIGSTNGKAGAVDFHLKGAGDLEVCSVETETCVTCHVPPPPK